MNYYEKEIKPAFDEFLKSNDRVLLFKGKWGTGKTTIFDKYRKNKLSELRKQRVPKKNNYGMNIDIEKKYAYISLFGIKTIEDFLLRAALSAPELQNTAQKIWQNVKKIISFIRFKGVSIQLPEGFTKSAIENSLDEFFICVDDLERRDRRLNLQSIFGTIDFLKVTKRCKIVIILNEDAILQEREKETLLKCLDKVVDIELEYAPDFIYNFTLVFDKFSNDYNTTSTIKETLQRADCLNIRTLHKARRTLERFSGILDRCDSLQGNHLRAQICQLVCLKYNHGIKIEDLGPISYISILMDKEEKGGNQVKLNELIKNMRFSPHVMDPVIIKLLNKGTIADSASTEIIEKWLTEVKQNKLNMEVETIYELLWLGFHPDKETLLKQIKLLIDRKQEDLSVESFKRLVDLHIKINEVDVLALEQEKFTTSRISKHNVTKNELAKMLELNITSALKDEIAKRKQEIADEISVATLVDRLCKTNDSWDSQDLHLLSDRSLNEIYGYFSDPQNKESRRELDIILNKTCYVQHQTNLKLVETISECIKKLIKDSDLNKIRTEKLEAKAKSFIEACRANLPGI